MTPAVGYVRVSTRKQRDEGDSLPMQIGKIRQYCDLNGLELVGIYGDPGISAKSIKTRPGLQAVLEMGDRRRIKAVVVFKLDRLARNTRECLDMAEHFRRKKIGLHSITEKLDTESPIGEFFFTLMASLAQMERKIIGERLKATLSDKKTRGEKTGGDPPYGYRVAVSKRANGLKPLKKIVPDFAEQKIIRRIRQFQREGLSTRQIASALDALGIKTRKGTRWSQTQIVRVLKQNPQERHGTEIPEDYVLST